MGTRKGDEAERENLLRLIATAFKGVERGEITLHQAWVIDRVGTAEEERAAQRLDTESRWQDIPDTKIAEFPTALSFVDMESFRYYLPAYMTWTLRYGQTDTTSSIIPDWTIYSLDSETTNEKLRRLLSKEQRRAVCLFLRYCAQHTGYFDAKAATRALKYWDRKRTSKDS